MSDIERLVAFVHACLDADEAAAQAPYDEAGDYRVVGSELAELHFVRWKPDRVLAEVAAKRAIVAEHSPPPPPREGQAGWVGCFACIEFAHEPEPCRTLRLLAQPYEGADGWHDAWKVER